VCRYLSKRGRGKDDEVNHPGWNTIDRILYLQPDQSMSGMNVLVKWAGRKYSDSTLERVETARLCPGYGWARRRFDRANTLPMHRRRRVGAATAALGFADPGQEVPACIWPSLSKDQLDAHKAMMAHWQRRQHFILCEGGEEGLTVDRGAAVFAATVAIHHRRAPVLVVLGNMADVAGWKSQFEHVAPELNVVVYSGTEAELGLVAKHELTLANTETEVGGPRALKFDVLITTVDLMKKPEHNALFCSFGRVIPLVLVDDCTPRGKSRGKYPFTASALKYLQKAGAFEVLERCELKVYISRQPIVDEPDSERWGSIGQIFGWHRETEATMDVAVRELLEQRCMRARFSDEAGVYRPDVVPGTLGGGGGGSSGGGGGGAVPTMTAEMGKVPTPNLLDPRRADSEDDDAADGEAAAHCTATANAAVSLPLNLFQKLANNPGLVVCAPPAPAADDGGGASRGWMQAGSSLWDRFK
jgi:hypothetical protein